MQLLGIECIAAPNVPKCEYEYSYACEYGNEQEQKPTEANCTHPLNPPPPQYQPVDCNQWPHSWVKGPTNCVLI